MKVWKLLWKIPCIALGVVSGIAVLLLAAVVIAVSTPSIRTALLAKGIEVANGQTDYDIDMGRLRISPFYTSPRVLYGAYKGKCDLPLKVELDSVFIGHRGNDTLAYIHRLRLDAVLHTAGKEAPFSNFTAIPITVNRLLLERTTFHSDSLIASIGIDAIVSHLETSSPELLIAEGQYPLHGLRLSDVDVGIDLRPVAPDTAVQDTTPLLLAFDLPDGELRNIHFRLTPLNLDIRTAYLDADALVDVGANLYDARRIDIGALTFSLGDLRIPADTIYGNAGVNLATGLITSSGLHVRSEEMGAEADLALTRMDLNSMRVDVVADAQYQGSKAQLRGFYDIDDEAYDMQVNIGQVNLSPILQNDAHIVLAGDIHAEGKGIDPTSPAMRSKVKMHLTDAVYDNITVSGIALDAQLARKTVTGNLHLPVTLKDSALQVRAQTEHQFRVAEFMTPERMAVDYRTQMRNVRTHVAGENIAIDSLQLDFATDKTTTLDLATRGLSVQADAPMHVLTFIDRLQPLLTAVSDSAVITPITSLTDLAMLDTLRRLIPKFRVVTELTHGSPVQHIIESKGLDIEKVKLLLASDSLRTDLVLVASMPEINHPEDSTAIRLPAVDASLIVGMADRLADASLTADAHLTDGAMSVRGLHTKPALRMDLQRTEQNMYGNGRLQLDSIVYDSTYLGSHAIDMQLSPSQAYPHALRANVQLDDVPLELVQSFISLPDIALHGAIRASASVDGLPGKPDISAEVLPLGVSVQYTPYQVGLSLGKTPIVMNHNHVDLNGLPIYGVDSSFVALTGGLDLDSMYVDVTLAADSFAPAKLPKDGALPVYGELATDIHGRVYGPLDSIVADVDVTLLPVTDITYPIDKKNLAQVKPHGTVNVRYGTADGDLNLGGRINVDDGFVRYSPKAYPIMPFHVDSGSHVAFHGPIGSTELNISASQKVKADVESADEDTRRVDFTTGVRVNGELDSIGIGSIGFFLEAPEDEDVTRELESIDEDTREGLAATLLATGMYVGESNVAAQRSGYALTSIINSRLNAAMANSKVGKFVDIDISSGQTSHAGGKTNDMNISVSKSFFKDRLRITLGSTLTDNPEINDTKGVFMNFSADYKLTKEGNISLRLYAQRDFNNILEGELYKSGLAVRATKEWRRRELFRGDSITRTYGLTADAGVAYRTNNSLGPDLTLKSSVKNLLGHGEIFTIKGNGAYYWALRNRHPGDPKKTDTYKLGANASLVFPYLHWVGDDNPEGDTRYMLGYQYENIAGGYGVHKVSGSFTYFIHSQNNDYVTHAFTPFSLSVVLMKVESDSLYDKASEFPQLLKIIAGNEFVPSIGYTFTYDNYRSRRAVNTFLSLGVKESGNLINAIYTLFGHDWNEKNKKLGTITFNQFVKLSAELHNRFNLTDKVSIATRLYAGTNIPLGNSQETPLSEAFYTGGPLSLRAASPYAYGPGNFYSAKYNQSFFHSGDIKLEANFELRFPIVWKLFGAAFVDAGNVWNWYSSANIFKAEGIDDYVERMQLASELNDGLLDNPDLAKQIALGTGAGLRLDIDGLVVRLDIGVGIHAPYQTYRYDKEWKTDYNQPINTYYNIPSVLDGLRFNFGIGYPF
ncbi:MAG: BamA/TamA family outer membrane protein [Paludibacteraceae bacterium]|nr:BamA/TamA family outer membrane protein [Paludibacteraceae bacterium]